MRIVGYICLRNVTIKLILLLTVFLHLKRNTTVAPRCKDFHNMKISYGVHTVNCNVGGRCSLFDNETPYIGHGSGYTEDPRHTHIAQREQ